MDTQLYIQQKQCQQLSLFRKSKFALGVLSGSMIIVASYVTIILFANFVFGVSAVFSLTAIPIISICVSVVLLMTQCGVFTYRHMSGIQSEQNSFFSKNFSVILFTIFIVCSIAMGASFVMVSAANQLLTKLLYLIIPNVIVLLVPLVGLNKRHNSKNSEGDDNIKLVLGGFLNGERNDLLTQEVNLTTYDMIGRGNHANVYKIDNYAVKDLKYDTEEIENVLRGIQIINNAANGDSLMNHHIMQEVPIYCKASDDHIQYVTKCMDGESTQVSDGTYKITHMFAKDAIKAVLFLNHNNIIYGNFKPCNFVYKKSPEQNAYQFYLQDFRAVYKAPGEDFSGDFDYKVNMFCNQHLSSWVQSTNAESFSKLYAPIRNLSGLLFTILTFHESPQGFLRPFKCVWSYYCERKNFFKFCRGIGIKEECHELLYKLCYSNIMLNAEELLIVEAALSMVVGKN